MKIRPVEAELFHVDGRTDRQMDRHGEANGRFSQFCEGAHKLLQDSSKGLVPAVAQQHRPSSCESYINQRQSSLLSLAHFTVLCNFLQLLKIRTF